MRNKLLNTLDQTICDYKSKNYLLAVSGGIDSMVLLDFFNKEQLSFGVAHCNFQLRGEDSSLDEQLVQTTCLNKNIKFHLKKFDTNHIAQTAKKSIQITARKLRYDWFNELAQTNQYDFIVTAHHANDNLETAIYKLAKGTGIKGARGILPLQHNILRPLLNYTKNELIAYAKKSQISWREDQSNKSTKYRRNYIRKEIIPLFEELNPQAVLNYTQSAERLRLAEQVLNDKITELKEKLLIKDKNETFSIYKSSFKSHNIDTPMLFELLSEFQFSYSTCQLICQNINQTSGANYQSKTAYELINDRDKLFISKKNDVNAYLKIPVDKGTYTVGNKRLNLQIIPYSESFEIEKNKQTVYFDATQVTGEFEIRTWQQGDKISPFGMKGKQKISDILINQKVPLNLKKNELVLVYKGQIIWLIGRRASNLYKITNSSILRIDVTENI